MFETVYVSQILTSSTDFPGCTTGHQIRPKPKVSWLITINDLFDEEHKQPAAINLACVLYTAITTAAAGGS
ncbi:hypothetical protein V6N13_117368 [Hibiscus sabdariffa]